VNYSLGLYHIKLSIKYKVASRRPATELGATNPFGSFDILPLHTLIYIAIKTVLHLRIDYFNVFCSRIRKAYESIPK